MRDQFFTPERVARNCLSFFFEEEHANVVADFACGDGALLKALPSKPKKVLALDIDEDIVQDLRAEQPNWEVRQGNFINPQEETSEWLSNWEKKVDLIVLNPPFTSRGRKPIKVTLNNQILTCRMALAFVVKSLNLLSPKGALIAILPLSVLKSERDSEVLKHIRRFWHIEVGNRFLRSSFLECTPNTVVLRLRRRHTFVNNVVPTHYKTSKVSVEIMRGSCPMYKSKVRGRYEVIHTTNLRASELNKRDIQFANSGRIVYGTYLCIPRVGKPSKSKVLIVAENTPYVLSDCVIAIKAKTVWEVVAVQELLFSNWNDFEILYESTCAPYITLNQITTFLAQHRVKATVVQSFAPTQ